MLLSGRWVRNLAGWLMASLLLWGTWQRLDHLDAKSLWSDELFTMGMAQYQLLWPKDGRPLYRQIQVDRIEATDTFLTAKAAEQSPPLNDLLVKAALNLPGPSEIASRIPAALSSSLLLLFFAAFAWRHPDPSVRRALWWATALLALHPTLIVYAREGRAYSLGASLVGMAGLLWMLRWRRGWRDWQPPGWIEITVFTLACYSHYNAALLVALLLSADAVMATVKRSLPAWGRLLTLGSIFSVWLALNAHAILFTAEGGVGWSGESPSERFMMARHDIFTAMHPPWVWLALAVVIYFAFSQWLKRRAHGSVDTWAGDGTKLWALAGIATVYLALAALVVSKAGMGHPRFFIFIIPLLSVMMGLMLAKVRPGWLAMVTLAAFASLITPSDRLIGIMGYGDFRNMGLNGVRGTDPTTYFVFPLEANRNFYRHYPHRFLGKDPNSRMVGMSIEAQAAQVCDQIKVHRHVVVFEHRSEGITNALKTSCANNWPMRSRQEFHLTAVEHWTRP